MTTILILVMVLFFTSCEKTEIDPQKKITVTEKSAKLIEADNAFGLELFREIAESEKQADNLMVSPLSVSLALAMTYNGAQGDTKTAMEKTLKLYGLTPDEINQTYQKLIQELKSVDKDVIFEIADAIFYRKGFSVEDNFISLNKTYYNADVTPLDFSSPNAVKTINDWVADKTHDKIPTIINQITPQQVMILLNAIYFNGLWTNKFDKNGTHNLPFNLEPGGSIEVPMMKQENKIDYTTNSLFSAIRLPYGTGQYSMVVLLPGQNKSGDDILNQLTLSNWKEWMDDFELRDHVVVTMPRFKFAYEADLNKVLSGMGMEIAFKPSQANFKGISNQQDLYIDKVKHKTYIDVNESGTEAAAVTAVIVGVTSFDPTPKIYFTVDKPFLFAITEKDTGAILFIGVVAKPEYKIN